MSTELIYRMQSRFDAIAQIVPDEEGVEFWLARDLQEPLGYARWENFLTAIQRAIESCETAGASASDHFRGVTKLIMIASRYFTMQCSDSPRFVRACPMEKQL